MKEHDCLRRFLFEELGIRGEWVRLEQSWQRSKQHQNLTAEVQEHLGQAIAASVLLSATIKFEGSLILQAQGNGALKTLVAQSTHDGKIRGLARSNDGVGALVTGTLSDMMGEGRMVITIEPKRGEPYQGIVALVGHQLSDTITAYFLQSEQLQTQVWLFANETTAAGLFLQELPAQKNYEIDWERISVLANTVTKAEMLTLNSDEMLYRLFNEEKVRLYDPESIEFECGCSQQKIESTLRALGKQSLDDVLQERENVEVDCEFCGQQYVFEQKNIDALFSGLENENIPETRH